MITIENYLEFWGKDLMKINISRGIEEILPPATIMFLHQYGLPTSERIYKERKNYLENTTPLPELILSEKNIERNIKALHPFIEFAPLLSDLFEFQGLEFVSIGIEHEAYDEGHIAIETTSGNINYIYKNPPPPLPAEFHPVPQNRFVNSTLTKLGMFLTAEFLARREMITPLKKYFDASKSKNYKLRDEMQKVADEIIDDLEKDFMELDSQALTTTESYWLCYLYEMRY